MTTTETTTGVGTLATTKAVSVRSPSTVPSWLVSVGSAVAAGLTTAGFGHLGTPVVATIDAISGLLVALHVHVALPRGIRSVEPRVVSAIKTLLG